MATSLLLAPASGEPTKASGNITHLPPPSGFISFCIRFPDQCDAGPGTADQVTLTREHQRLLEQVNADVNGALWPEDDETHYGRPEYWTIPTDGYGDCDDYALTKRKALVAKGLPKRALRIAIVVVTPGERHAVLVVATDKGDFVLDNLTDHILERRETSYTWVEQQDPNNPIAWISLSPSTIGDRQAAVGSLK